MKKDIRIKKIKEGTSDSSLMSDKPKVSFSSSVQPERKKKSFLRRVFLFIFCLISGGLGGILAERFLFPYLVSFPFFSKIEFLQSAEKPVIVEKTEKITIEQEAQMEEVVKKVRPSVVEFVQKKTLSENLFKPEIIGTGLVLTSDGLIATSKSVLSGKLGVEVKTSQGMIYPISEIILDPSLDLAFVRIKAKDLISQDFVQEEDILLGKKVIAFSSGKLLSGIVSQQDVSYQIFEKELPEHQFFLDFDLEEGILGGPVFDLSGKILGLFVKHDKNQGKNFPVLLASEIKRTLLEVISENKITRPTLGIYYIPITSEFSAFNNILINKGVLIESGDPNLDPIVFDGPAYRAKLKKGDIISAIKGEEINQENSLFEIIQKYNPGDEVEVTYFRENQEQKVKVVLGGL